MPNNTACFTDGSWTAATPTRHRFAQEPSPQENVATAGLFYCADSSDWVRHPMIAVYISGGNLIRAHSAFPMELLALCMDLAFQTHTNTTRRIVSDCQAAITLLSLCMQEKHSNVQLRTHSNITMACHGHLPSGAHIEKVKAHQGSRQLLLL